MSLVQYYNHDHRRDPFRNIQKLNCNAQAKVNINESLVPFKFAHFRTLNQPELEDARLILPPIVIVEKYLGRGGWGNVYMVTRVKDGKRLAAKIVPIRASHFLKDVKLLQTEVLAHSSLKGCGENIVQFQEAIMMQTHSVILMEFCDRGNLWEVLSSPRSRNDGMIELTYLRDILLGVQAMHGRKVAHCDLKPENVLVAYNSRLKIADFGHSFIRTSSRRMSQSTVGTPLYSAPEIACGQIYDPFVADIWSIGATFFTILTGQKPFSKEQCSERKGRITHEDVVNLLKPLRKFAVSSACLFLLKSFLEVDPTLRITLDSAMMLCNREIKILCSQSTAG